MAKLVIDGLTIKQVESMLNWIGSTARNERDYSMWFSENQVAVPDRERKPYVERFANGDRVIYMKTFESPPEYLKNGTKVKTSISPDKVSDDWCAEALKNRKSGVTGTVSDSHDSHGLYYDVMHEDGTLGAYEPHELIMLGEVENPYGGPRPWGPGNPLAPEKK